MKGRRAAGACLVLALFAAGGGRALFAIEPSQSAAFLKAARAAQARGSERSVERLVTAERWNAYEAFYETLKSEADLSPGGLAESLASAYAGAFGDRALEDALLLARSWTPEQRARRNKTFDLRATARQAAQDGRLDEAAETYESVLRTYVDLGDVREGAWLLSNLGGVAVMRGRSRDGLAYLDRAVEEARKVRDDTVLGAAATNRAYVLVDLGETDAALAAYEQALEVARRTGDRHTEMRALASRGTLFTSAGRLEEAAADFLAAAAAAERVPDFEVQCDAWLNLSTIDALRGDTETQLAHLRKSAEASRRGHLPLYESDANLVMAGLARRRGDFEECRRVLASSRAALAGSDDTLRLTKLDLEEVSLRVARGRYAEALPILDAAERRLAGLELGGSRAEIFLARAVALYHLGDYDGAVGQLRASVEESKTKDRPETQAEARAQLGYLLFTLGDAAAGVADLEEAIRIEDQIGDKPGRGSRLEAIGFIRYRTGDLAGARQALEAALADLSAEVDPAGRAEAMRDLGLVQIAMGGEERRRGLDRLREARESLTRLGDLQGSFHANLLEADALLAERDTVSAQAALDRAARIPAARVARSEIWLADHLHGRLAELGGDTATARRRYQRAVDEVESLRGAVRPAPWRAALLEDRIAPYRALVRLLRDQGDVGGAWQVARAAKARTFVESVTAPGIPPLLAPDPGRGPEVVPASWRAAPAWGPAPPSRLGAFLRDDERLIDFFLDGGEVTAFVLSRQGLVARTLRLGEAADLRTARWPGRPVDADAAVTAAWRHVMARIGASLFEPLSADVAGAARLLIVPAGPLNGLPFAAVEMKGRRLVDQYEIGVLPAAEALLSRGRRAAGSGALVMGDPASGGARLPAAAREAQAVAALAGADRALVGEAASEASFVRLAPAADRIHVAAHGRIDRVAPARTYLALAAGGGSDGRLEAGEVAGMVLAATLVVLSGCGTGVDGGMARGDAPADEREGLPRAFLQAGAGAVVASLWEMDDAASAAFVPRLYRAPRSRGAAAALAEVQRDLAAGRIRGEDGTPLDHPYYWAGLLAWGAGLAPTP
jgi:tetratricopeptide (TPR) repeat protein